MAPITLLIGAGIQLPTFRLLLLLLHLAFSLCKPPQYFFFSVVNNVFVVVIYEISTIDLNKNILNTIFDIIILGGWGDKCVFF